MNNPVTIKPKAVDHFLVLIKKEKAKMLFISVNEKGCSGKQYALSAIHEAPKDTLVFHIDSLCICMPQKDLHLLENMVIDLLIEGIQKTITFNNPNAENACGCGMSFSKKVQSSQHKDETNA